MSKVLIIRSAPIDQFQNALEIVQSREPNTEIYVLTQANSTVDLLNIGSVRVYNYRPKTINIFSLGISYIKRLQSENFKKIYILYANHLGDGYDNVRFLSFCLGVEEIFGINVEGEIIPIKRFESISDYIKEKVQFVYHGIIWFFLLIKKKIKGLRSENRD